VLLVSIDTLRRDHLGCYGYGRETSPRIDAFAAGRAILFDRAYTQAPYTLPAHLSMLTGLYPHAHGILLPMQDGRPPRLDDPVETLAERFRAAGFRTAAFTDGGLVDSKYGFDQGFESYEDERVDAHVDNGFERFEGRLHRWIEAHRAEDQFVFVHTFDVHGPYEAPEGFAGRFRDEPPGRPLPDASLLVPSLQEVHGYLELDRYDGLRHLIDDYDACIRFVDDRIGALLDHVEELGLMNRATIVLTSDHGEDFLEDDLTLGHARFLSEAVTRVPLIVKLPGDRRAGIRSEAIVELVDLAPTLLEVHGLEPLDPVDGESLLRAIRAPRDTGLAFATSPFGGEQHTLVRRAAWFAGGIERPLHEFVRWHLQAARPRDPRERPGSARNHYDFRRDPYGLLDAVTCRDRVFSLEGGEPIETSDPDLLESMRREAEGIAERGRATGFSSGDASTLDEEERRRLEALGYVAVLEDEGNETSGPGSGTDPSGAGATPHDRPGRPEYDIDCEDADRRRVDRTLLHEGDETLWTLHRMRRGHLPPGGRDEVDRLAATARRAWSRFAERHPDRPTWIPWRLAYLDLVVERLERARDETD